MNMPNRIAIRTLHMVAVLAAAFPAIVPLPAAAQQAFTTGNLVVNRLGNGIVTDGTTTVPINILEVTTAGSLVQTISLPSSGANAQTDVFNLNAGQGLRSGMLNFYQTGSGPAFLSTQGYNVPAGTTAITGTFAKAVSILGMSGTVANFFSGTSVFGTATLQPNASLATSGSTFFLAGFGTTGSTFLFFNGSTPSYLSTNQQSVRNVEIYNNQLYASANLPLNSSGIVQVGTGVPTSGTQTWTRIIPGPTDQFTSGLVMFDTNNDGVLDRAYTASNPISSSLFSVAGISRWDLTGGSWIRTGTAYRLDTSTNLLTLNTGSMTSNFQALMGLSGVFAGGTATLYATTSNTSNNQLVRLVDTGAGFSTSTPFTTLQTSGENYSFRGVDIVPVPEPAAVILAGLGVAVSIAFWRRRAAG